MPIHLPDTFNVATHFVDRNVKPLDMVWSSAGPFVLRSVRARDNMANRFGADILIQALDPKRAALFYVNHLGFEITDNNPKMIGLHGQHLNLFIEPGPPLGPVLEVTVDNVAGARQRLVEQGCEVVKDEPDFPRCYIKDPFGLIYNLTS